MRLAAVTGRATLILDHTARPLRGIDVERSSGGRFSSDPQQLYPRWTEFREWATQLGPDTAGAGPIEFASLTNPVPQPRQIFAIGVNYRGHAVEVGLSTERGLVPSTFTKFPASLAGAREQLHLPSATVDWEIELVAVLGATADHASPGEAPALIAGFAVGQDFSERTLQMSGPAPQFSLAKSFPGFSPIGPWLTTLDELTDPSDLELACTVNGETVQHGRTSEMIWPVTELIVALSAVCPLWPGDIIFTGTPAGIGAARTPPRYLAPGDVVSSSITGLGNIEQTCAATATAP